MFKEKNKKQPLWEGGKELASGKTKTIFGARHLVIVSSKNIISSGDGENIQQMTGKAAIATETTVNCFKLLHAEGIPNHFVAQIDETAFLAKMVEMVPIEIVIRRIATGSYLKRSPNTPEGTRFNEPVIEFFWKDDANHDPLMTWDPRLCEFILHNPKLPVSQETVVGKVTACQIWNPKRSINSEFVEELEKSGLSVFLALEASWAKLGVSLVDLKIECGFTTVLNEKGEQESKLVVADVIDNDSWRIWPNGQKSQMLDKQLFRDTKTVTTELLKNYEWVAEATKEFVKS